MHLIQKIKPSLFIPLFILLMLPKSIFALSVNPGDPGFATELDAVSAALNMYNPVSLRENREYMGIIYQDGENFRYTVTAGQKNRDSLSIRINQELLQCTVALWHTHGGAGGSYKYFSDTDTDTATQLNLPFYLADYTGYLKVFRPGDDTLSPFQARKRGLSNLSGFALGTKVLDFEEEPIKINTVA